MNKTDWLKELNRLIKDLPYSERKKATDYYSELYADKIEAGMNTINVIKKEQARGELLFFCFCFSSQCQNN